ncbi:MAG TPA: DUF4440 domain-containing protein [Terriglobales bacterium]|jgi:hypothetical protein|nr:DUF4440 domain-containing protein [Terriglobales bacterium]
MKPTAIFLALVILTACTRLRPITQQELVDNTQQLMDSVAPGDKTPWQKFYADNCMYFDEKGHGMNKAALLADLSPMPNGYSGAIKVVNAHSHIASDVAILSYDMDETETIFGQNMTARYHATDTWMLRNGQWQIVAGQVLRYYEDPAVGKVDPKKLADYVGDYQLAAGNVQTVSTDGHDLYAQRSGRAKTQLYPESPDLFFRKGVEGRFLFRRSDDEKVSALVDRRNNEDVVWQRLR